MSEARSELALSYLESVDLQEANAYFKREARLTSRSAFRRSLNSTTTSIKRLIFPHAG